MSKQAKQHYAEMASRFGLKEVPEILNGSSYQMGSVDEEISVRTAFSFEVVRNYREIIHTIGNFVIQNPNVDLGQRELPCAVDSSFGGRTTYNFGLFDKREEYIHKVVGKGRLMPKNLPGTSHKLVTGSLRDVQVEAVTPDDLPEKLLEQARKRKDYPKELEQDSVFLVESAALYLGRTVGRVANLTVVSVDASERPPIKLMGKPFSHNRGLAASGMWESAAIASYIDHWGIQSAVTQNVRRGSDQRGRKQ